MASNWIVGVIMLLGLADFAHAQELRCNQVFMNPSEKRICATPALMDLDVQIGELGRRAAMHQSTFKSEQRKFRKALKACDGNEECLTGSYQLRIAELQAYVDTLPAPTESEEAKLVKAGEKAGKKRDSQEATRAKIAVKLNEQDTNEQDTNEHAYELSADEQRQISDEPIPTEDAPEELDELQVVPTVELTQPTQPATVSGTGEVGWGGIALMGVIVLVVLGWLKSWLERAVRRCPSCKKWFAGKVIDSDREAYTDYETKTFEDVHRDRNQHVTGRTTKKRQVKVRVVESTYHYQCLHCDNKWAWTSTSRSS